MKKITSFTLLTLALAFVSCEQRSDIKDKSSTYRSQEKLESANPPKVIEIETEEETPDEIDIEDEEFDVDTDENAFKPAPPVRVENPTPVDVRTAPANRDELRRSWRDAKDLLREKEPVQNGARQTFPNTPNANQPPVQNGNLRQLPPNQSRSSFTW